MSIKPLYDACKGTPRVGILISGSGTNAVEIIKYARNVEADTGILPYDPVVIYSDKKNSNAIKIAKTFKIDHIVEPRSFKLFCKDRGINWQDTDLSEPLREEYDAQTVEKLEDENVDFLSAAGHMLRRTKVLLKRYLSINVHPGKLSIVDENGGRVLVGADAVGLALKLGHKEIYSSTHIMSAEVDQGPILMVSDPVKARVPQYIDLEDKTTFERVRDEHQNRLKVIGDWQIFPLTLHLIAEGAFARDETGMLYMDDLPIPDGWAIEDSFGGKNGTR